MIRVYISDFPDGDPKNAKGVGYVNVAVVLVSGKDTDQPLMHTHEAEFKDAKNGFLGRVQFEAKATDSNFKVLALALHAARKKGLFG